MVGRRALVLGGAAVLSLALSGCVGLPIAGSGQVVSQTRPVSGFSEVAVSGGALLIVKQSGQESLRIQADDNLIDKVQAEVRDGKLWLGFKPGQTS